MDSWCAIVTGNKMEQSLLDVCEALDKSTPMGAEEQEKSCVIVFNALTNNPPDSSIYKDALGCLNKLVPKIASDNLSTLLRLALKVYLSNPHDSASLLCHFICLFPSAHGHRSGPTPPTRKCTGAMQEAPTFFVEEWLDTLLGGLDKSNFKPHLQLIELIMDNYTGLVLKYSRFKDLRFVRTGGDHRYFVTNKQLGYGQYGNVLQAIGLENGDPYAVKIIDWAKFAKQPKMRDHLAKEVEIMLRLDNPHIVRLFRADRFGDYLFLLMEMCNGGQLDTWAAKKKHLNEADVKHIMRQLSFGLQFLIESNINHRDLKPANLLLHYTSDDSLPILKIADFSHAKSAEEDMMNHTLCGTPIYMAPEVWTVSENGGYSAKSDLWSVGVVMHELMTGKLPFEISKPAGPLAIKALVISSQEIPIQLSPRVEAEFSAECKNLLSSLLKKDPNNRISWEEFFLHPFLKGGKSLATPEGGDARMGLELRQELEELKCQLEATKEEVCRLTEENKRLEQTNRLNDIYNSRYEVNVETFKKKEEEKAAELERLKARVNELTENMSVKDEMMTAAIKQHEEDLATIESLKGSKEMIEVLKKEVDKALGDLKESQASEIECRNLLKECENKVQDLSKALEQASPFKEKATTLEKQVGSLEGRIAEAESDKSKLSLSIKKQEEELQRQKGLTKKAEEQVTELKDKIQALCAEGQEASSKEASLQASLDQTKKELLSCTSSLAKAKEEKESVEDLVKQTKAELEEARNSVASHIVKQAELEECINSLKALEKESTSRLLFLEKKIVEERESSRAAAEESKKALSELEKKYQAEIKALTAAHKKELLKAGADSKKEMDTIKENAKKLVADLEKQFNETATIVPIDDENVLGQFQAQLCIHEETIKCLKEKLVTSDKILEGVRTLLPDSKDLLQDIGTLAKNHTRLREEQKELVTNFEKVQDSLTVAQHQVRSLSDEVMALRLAAQSDF